ncbi:MAG TPA: TIGR03435 family protein [Bryobacteraceae bacterium]|nr:TIGR03435 family protein [Bryobacteraceae bacterium]
MPAMRGLKLGALGCVLAAAAALGQSQVGTSPRPEFEVATVKLRKGPPAEPRVQMTPGRLSVLNLSLRDLIGIAYRVKDSQISNGPGWIKSERYDVDAKTDSSANGADAMLAMLQSLLEGRFQLRFHHEAREQAVYLLTVARGGVRMHEATCVPFDPNQLQKQAGLSDQERARQCGGNRA